MNSKQTIFLVVLFLAITVGLSALSPGINTRFEAEYASGEYLHPYEALGDNNRLFYVSPKNDRAGYFVFGRGYSNRYCWMVEDGTSGYAFKDLIHRQQGVNAYHAVGKQLGTLANPANDAKLNIKYVFRVDELDNYIDTDTLAVFSFVIHRDNTGSNYGQLLFYHDSNPNPIREFALTMGEYNKLPIIDRVTNLRAIEFTFTVGGDGGNADCSLIKQGVVKTNSRHLEIDNLNPWMYWNGKGRLKLDYVEYKES